MMECELDWLDRLLSDINAWNMETRSSMVVAMIYEEIINRIEILEYNNDR